MATLPHRTALSNAAIAVTCLVLALAACRTRASEKISAVNVVTLTLDNDIVVGSDGDYTAGAEIAWSFAAQTSFDELVWLPKWYVSLAQATPLGKKNYDVVGSDMAIGMKIFTPHDLLATELVPNDRPYASFALHGLRGDLLDSLELSLGVVGPGSLAGELQRATHGFFNDDPPRGWENQLKNEPGIIVSYQRDRRLWPSETRLRYTAELVETRGVSLGNIETNASFGWRGRFGRLLPSDFRGSSIYNGEPRFIQSGVPVTAASPTRFYFEGGFTGYFIARNIFLDGNTFTDSHSVDKRNWVAEFSYGIGFERKRCRISFLYNYRTKEFTQQNGGAAFGSFAVSFH